jgi:hypothetical protein
MSSSSLPDALPGSAALTQEKKPDIRQLVASPMCKRAREGGETQRKPSRLQLHAAPLLFPRCH